MKEMEIGEFHWTEGWFFKRVEDGPTPGSVRIVKVNAAGEVIAKAIIPAPEWESIISHVSARGEPANYQRAVDFHMDPA